MNKTLVIHPKDETTTMLEEVYRDKGYDVINDPAISKADLYDAIKKHDRIIMLGHGTPGGLIDPRVKDPNMYCSRMYIIDSDFADILRNKETISVWCFSDQYFAKHNIKGFHTGMIISEVMESIYMLGYSPLTEVELYQNMIKFSKIIGECIDLSAEEMRQYVLTHYDDKDAITQFNRKNIKVL